MIKVTISLKGGSQVWSQFETQELADTYVAGIIASEHWGRNARWIREGEGDISVATDERTVVDFPALEEEIDENDNIIQYAREEVSHTEYFIPAEYSITQEDITEQVEKENAIKLALQAQEKGARIIGRVWAINESKNLSPEDFGAIINDETLARIERLLWSGSLKTAKILVQTSPNLTDYFTQDEIDEIVAMLD